MKWDPGIAADEPCLLVPQLLHRDRRGALKELWNADLLGTSFQQGKLSHSNRGTMRGLHYQVHEPQGKLIQVLCGRILDVAVDVRKSSPTFGAVYAFELRSDDSHDQVWVPPGFAHGFQALDWSCIMYLVSGRHAPEYERAIWYKDPKLAIEWPIIPAIVSAKDRDAPRLEEAEVLS